MHLLQRGVAAILSSLIFLMCGEALAGSLPRECVQMGGDRECAEVSTQVGYTYDALDLGLPPIEYVTGVNPPFLNTTDALDDYALSYFGPEVCAKVVKNELPWHHDDDGFDRTTANVQVNAGPGCMKYLPHDVILAFGPVRTCPQGLDLTLVDGNYYCRGAGWRRTDRQKNMGKPLACEGNPCNVATGNKFQEEIDYRGPNVGGLEFVRSYNSFSGGWLHTYQRSILRIETPSALPRSWTYLTRADGRVLLIREMGPGAFEWDADLNIQFTQVLDMNNKVTGFKVVTESDGIEMYDASGALLSLTDRAGLKQTLIYETINGTRALKSVTDAFGRQLVFTNDTLGRLKTMSDPVGNLYQYAYDALDRVASVTYPEMKIRTYIYNEPANTGGTSQPKALTGIIDENNVRYATWKYDAHGDVVYSEHANGVGRVLLSYARDEHNEPASTSVVDSNGYSRTYTISIDNHMARVASLDTVCDGCVDDASSRSYDANGNLEQRIDQKGLQSDFKFDLSRNLQTRASVSSKTVDVVWHSRFRLPIEVKIADLTTTYAYEDATGALKSVTETDTKKNVTRTSTYTTDANGMVKRINGPRTDVNDFTDMTYDAEGNVKTVTNALGHVTEFQAYDKNGRVLTMKDPNGAISKVTYDGRGNVKSTQIGQETTLYDYYNTGLLRSVTFPSGEVITYTYDDAHRLTDIKNSSGEKIHYTLDDFDNRTKEEIFDSAGVLTFSSTASFDRYSRLQKRVQASGLETTFETDEAGNLKSVTDPLSRQTAFALDEFQRVREITHPDQSSVKQDFDENDQLNQVTNEKNALVTYAANALGNVKEVRTTDPDDFSRMRDFDSAGNLKWKKDFRGITTTYTYDALNRVKTISAPGAVTTTFTYDVGTNAKGRLSSMVDESGTTTRTYNLQGRIESSTRTFNGLTIKTSYGYDVAGRLKTITYPSGRVVTYNYDKEQVVGVDVGATALIKEIKYEPFGGVRSWRWGNGKEYSRTTDLDGQPSSYSMANGSKEIKRDDSGNIKSIVDSIDQSQTQRFAYDARDRVTDYFVGANSIPKEHYDYDAAGNRTAAIISGVPYSYGYFGSTDFLATVSGPVSKSWQPDATGSTISDGTHVFKLDSYRRIASVTTGSVKIDYLRNGLDQRITKRSIDGSSTHFVYDEDGQLLAELDKLGNTVAEHVWLDALPIGVVVSGDVNYVYSDHLDTPRLITDTTNRIRWSWQSNPFGSTQPNNNPAGLGTFTYNLRFPGQYYDVESGLHNNHHRDYDPQVGRYTQSDLIGQDGGTNTFAYVGSNPLSDIDPLGLFGWRDAAGFVPVLGSGLDAYDAYTCGNYFMATVNVGLALADLTGTGALIKGLTVGTMRYSARKAIREAYRSTDNWNAMRRQLQRIGEIPRNTWATKKNYWDTTDHIFIKQRKGWSHRLTNHPANLQTNVLQWKNTAFENMGVWDRTTQLPTWMKLTGMGVVSYGAGQAVGAGANCGCNKK